MKITTNYDLMDKVKEARCGVKNNYKRSARLIPYNCLVLLLNHNLINNIGILISSSASELIGIFLIEYNLYNILDITIFQERNIKVAEIDLHTLAMELTALDVRTTGELLKDSKIIKNNYKIKYVDDKKLRIVNQKYIDIPVCSGYKETILQEHSIGSTKYDIEVKGLYKQLSFKPAKSNA